MFFIFILLDAEVFEELLVGFGHVGSRRFKYGRADRIAGDLNGRFLVLFGVRVPRHLSELGGEREQGKGERALFADEIESELFVGRVRRPNERHVRAATLAGLGEDIPCVKHLAFFLI